MSCNSARSCPRGRTLRPALLAGATLASAAVFLIAAPPPGGLRGAAPRAASERPTGAGAGAHRRPAAVAPSGIAATPPAPAIGAAGKNPGKATPTADRPGDGQGPARRVTAGQGGRGKVRVRAPYTA